MNISQCGRVQAQLLLFLGGELPPLKAALVRDHIRACPACNAQLKALTETQQQVKVAMSLTMTAPSTLDARVMARVRQSAKTRHVSRFRLAPLRRVEKYLALSLAALCLMGGSYLSAHSWFVHHRTLTNVAGEPIPTSQVTALRDDYLSDLKGTPDFAVTGSDPVQVATGLAAQGCATPHCVVPITFKENGVQTLGGGWCQVAGRKIAFMTYTWNGERVTLYQGDQNSLAIPECLVHPAPDGDLCYEPVQQGNLSGVVWGKGTRRYVMFAQMPSDRLLTLAYSAQQLS